MGKRVDDLATIDWQGYAGKEAVFPVCMKSPAVNGRRLKAQLVAAKDKIDNLILVICDSLDRHNVAGIVNAQDHCIAQGDEWLESNLPVVRDFFPNVQVLRWEKDIKSHPKFYEYLYVVTELYKKSAAIKRLRDSMSLYYLISKKKRFDEDWNRGVAGKFNLNLALKSSADYLDEEFAGDMVYYEMTGGIPHIYWGLYVDDYKIFARESGLNLGFPQTLSVSSKRLGASFAASELPYTKLISQKDNIFLKTISK